MIWKINYWKLLVISTFDQKASKQSQLSHTHTHTHTHKHTHAQTHTHSTFHVHPHKHTKTQAHSKRNKKTCSANTHTCTQKHTHTHTTHTHTYIHTHIHKLLYIQCDLRAKTWTAFLYHCYLRGQIQLFALFLLYLLLYYCLNNYQKILRCEKRNNYVNQSHWLIYLNLWTGFIPIFTLFWAISGRINVFHKNSL